MRTYTITAGPLTYTSAGGPFGGTNPGALNVELDVPLQAHDVIDNSAYCRVWGIPLADISQAQALFGQPCTITGGMAAGLPLAMPQQAGTLCSGKIFKAFGNWQGTDMTLDLIISPSGVDSSQAQPGPNPVQQTKPVAFSALKGQPWGDAIQQALTTAYPDLQVAMRVGNITAQTDQHSYHTTVESFALWLRRYTQMLTGGQGVSIHTFDGTMNVFDGSQPQQAGQIAYTDLIGQPTWIDAQVMQIKVVMRADVHVGDTITLPQTLVTNTAGGGFGSSPTGASRETLTFQGAFQVKKIHHLGNFRQPDANSWVTVIDAFTSGGTASSGVSGSSTFSQGTY